MQQCPEVYHWASHLEKPIILAWVHPAVVPKIRMIVQVVCVGIEPRKYWQESSLVRQGREKSQLRVHYQTSCHAGQQEATPTGELQYRTHASVILPERQGSWGVYPPTPVTGWWMLLIINSRALPASPTQGQKSLQVKSHRCWKSAVGPVRTEVLGAEGMSTRAEQSISYIP